MKQFVDDTVASFADKWAIILLIFFIGKSVMAHNAHWPVLLPLLSVALVSIESHGSLLRSMIMLAGIALGVYAVMKF